MSCHRLCNRWKLDCRATNLLSKNCFSRFCICVTTRCKIRMRDPWDSIRHWYLPYRKNFFRNYNSVIWWIGKLSKYFNFIKLLLFVKNLAMNASYWISNVNNINLFTEHSEGACQIRFWIYLGYSCSRVGDKITLK